MGSEVAVAAMARMKSSEVRLKRIALMGQPCLTPDRMGMAAVSPSAVRMVVVEPL